MAKKEVKQPETVVTEWGEITRPVVEVSNEKDAKHPAVVMQGRQAKRVTVK